MLSMSASPILQTHKRGHNKLKWGKKVSDTQNFGLNGCQMFVIKGNEWYVPISYLSIHVLQMCERCAASKQFSSVEGDKHFLVCVGVRTAPYPLPKPQNVWCKLIQKFQFYGTKSLFWSINPRLIRQPENTFNPIRTGGFELSLTLISMGSKY